MDWAARRDKFRAIVAGESCVNPASVYDPISARIAEDLGYELGMLGGSTAALAVLGSPDLVTLTLTELAQQVLRIGRAGNLPLLVDADHGFGNALSVKRTVEELETAGAAGLTIEDTLLPVAYGAGGKPQLISLEEGVGKMKAALAGRQDPRLVIAGRTGAPGISGIEDAIRRVKAYAAAGVDVVFLTGIKDRAGLDAVAAAIDLPIFLGNTPGELRDPAYLAARRVRVGLLGHQPIAAATQAVYETMKALRGGTDPAKLAGMPSSELVSSVTREADYKSWTKTFLAG